MFGLLLARVWSAAVCWTYVDDACVCRDTYVVCLKDLSIYLKIDNGDNPIESLEHRCSSHCSCMDHDSSGDGVADGRLTRLESGRVVEEQVQMQ